jgi:hypothetical protein
MTILPKAQGHRDEGSWAALFGLAPAFFCFQASIAAAFLTKVFPG